MKGMEKKWRIWMCEMTDYMNLFLGTLVALSATANIGFSYHRALARDFQYCILEQLQEPQHWKEKQGLETFLDFSEIVESYQP